MARISISYQFGWFDQANVFLLDEFHPGEADSFHNGVSILFDLTNNTGKTIKYMTLFFIPYNAVGETVFPTQDGMKGNNCRFVGPINSYASKKGNVIHNLWYTNAIKSIKLALINIEYMDGTEETIYTKKGIYDYLKAERTLQKNQIDAEVKKINAVVDWDGTMISENILSLLGASQSKPASGGCYVATSVYGSYDCPQVWVLRRYRDFALAENPFGRLFIRIYYKVSPTLVKWFGDSKWFTGVFKPILDKKVRKLQNKGYSSSAYEDRKW